MISFTAKKRGEVVRRYRKIKGAALNLSIGMLIVAALLTFNSGFNTTIKGGGGKKKTVMLEPDEITYVKPAPKINRVEAPPMQFNDYQLPTTIDHGLAGLAPVQAPTQAPTMNYNIAPTIGIPTAQPTQQLSPTVLQY